MSFKHNYRSAGELDHLNRLDGEAFCLDRERPVENSVRKYLYTHYFFVDESLFLEDIKRYGIACLEMLVYNADVYVISRALACALFGLYYRCRLLVGK